MIYHSTLQYIMLYHIIYEGPRELRDALGAALPDGGGERGLADLRLLPEYYALSVSLSLSLFLCIYIYIHTHM